MSSNPSARKRREALDAVSEDLGGDLFGDLGLTELEEDPIYKMRKYVTHFRLMVLSDNFPYLHEGTILTYGKTGAHDYASGQINADGTIEIPARKIRVESLTGYASAVVPDKWSKTDGRTGLVGRARPDGWERVWATLDNGAELRVEEILFKHYKELGYTIEQLSDIEFLHSELSKAGHEEVVKDLSSELKAYQTKIGKQK